MNLLQYEIRNPLFDCLADSHSPLQVDYDPNDDFLQKINVVYRMCGKIAEKHFSIQYSSSRRKIYRTFYDVTGHDIDDCIDGFELYQRDDPDAICHFAIEFDCVNVPKRVNVKPLDLVIQGYERGEIYNNKLLLRIFNKDELYESFGEHEYSEKMLWIEKHGTHAVKIDGDRTE